MLPRCKQLVQICALGLVFGFAGVVRLQGGVEAFESASTLPPSTPLRRGWKQEVVEGGRWTGERWTGRIGSDWRTMFERTRLSGHSGGKGSPQYLVLAPTMVRPESVYGVVVGILGDEGGGGSGGGDVSVRASLTTTSTSSHRRQLAQAQGFVSSGTFSTIYMKIGADIGGGGDGGAVLHVEGRRGSQMVFSNTTTVTTTKRFLSVLVQMSRPIYTGSQKVEFRVVLLKTDLRPYQGPVHVHVLDTDGYVVRRWLSRFPSTGMIELGLGTPGLPKPGWWRVKVQAGTQVHYHPFYITKYFAPRFEVLVEVPFSTLAGSGGIQGRFGAFYLTYRPIPITANLTLYLKPSTSKVFTKVFTEQWKMVEGWQEFQYPLERLLTNSTISSSTFDLINAQVKVEVKGRHTFLADLYTAHARTRIVAPEVKVQFVGSEPLVFKPGMSLTAAVGVSYEDGEPLSPDQLSHSSLTLSSTITRRSGGSVTLPQIVAGRLTRDSGPWSEMWTSAVNKYNYYYKDDKSSSSSGSTGGGGGEGRGGGGGGRAGGGSIGGGSWQYRNDVTLSHHQAILRYQQDGILQFTLDLPEDATGLEVTATYRDLTSEGGTRSSRVKGVPYHSPEGHYLHVTTSPSVIVTVGGFAIFHVRANFPMGWYRYMVLAKGVLLHSGTEHVEQMGRTVVSTLSLAVAREMSPRFTLAVLHVTQAGAVLVDTIHVAVQLPYSDQVELVLNQNKDHSKRTVEAAMRARPGTQLALSCTRWPSWLAHHASRITPARLVMEALLMEPHPRPVHTVRQVSRSGAWTEQLASLTTEGTGGWSLAALHLAGLTCLTDAVMSSPPHTGWCSHEAGFLECGDGSCYRQSEVCDGTNHCHNAADEIHCLSVTQDFQGDQLEEGRLQKTPEIEEAEFRVTHRTWWRDLFDKKEGSWCRTHTHFGHKGYERVDLPVPHSPGRWVVEGFALHPDHGLTLLPEQDYDATPPLLMRLQAAPVCRRGEQISIRVHLHNSMNRTVLVMVVLQDSPDYSFVHVQGDASVSHYRPRLSRGDHQHLVTVPGGEWREVMIPLAVKRQAGNMAVVVKAVSQLHTRTATHMLSVKPEGAGVRTHTSVLLDLKSRATVYEFLDLPLDQSPIITNSIFRRFIYGSPQAALTLSGDVFGPVQKGAVMSFTKAFQGRILKSTDGLAFNFGTTLWTLHYLRLTQQLRPNTTKKAFDFLNVMLAGLLTRFKDGGFRMWHFSKPSVWVTAWALRVILGAQLEEWENLVYIEPRLVSACVAFLIDHQDAHGGFTETVHHANESFAYTMTYKGVPDADANFKARGAKSTGSGAEGEEPLIALTALIVTVLHDALPTLTGNVHTRAINAKFKATSLLERTLDKLWDPYEVSITTYALNLVDSPEKDVAFYTLQAMALDSPDGGMHWSREPVVTNIRQSQNNQRNLLLPKTAQAWDSYAVEATGYALLTVLLREGVTARAEAAVRWLSSVRDWDMAFVGTVDTVVAMRALAEYSYRARLRDVTRMTVMVETSSSPDLVHSLAITNTTISAMHSFKVPRPWGHVSLMAKGSGQAVAQLDMTWGVDLARYLEKPPRKYFDLTVTETFPPPSRNKSLIATRVCVRWTAVDLSPASHAAFLEIDVATGYFLSQPCANKWVRRAQASDMPMLMDAKATRATMFWQFTHIPGDRARCFDYQMVRQDPAANLTAVRDASIFEMFAPEHFETTVINASSLSALDICEVCGSYQCPYCPNYSGDSTMPLPRPTLIFSLLVVLVVSFSGPSILNPQNLGILALVWLIVSFSGPAVFNPQNLGILALVWLIVSFSGPAVFNLQNLGILALVWVFIWVPLVISVPPSSYLSVLHSIFYSSSSSLLLCPSFLPSFPSSLLSSSLSPSLLPPFPSSLSPSLLPPFPSSLSPSFFSSCLSPSLLSLFSLSSTSLLNLSPPSFLSKSILLPLQSDPIFLLSLPIPCCLLAGSSNPQILLPILCCLLVGSWNPQILLLILCCLLVGSSNPQILFPTLCWHLVGS